MKRAIRRHHYQRLKKRVKYFWDGYLREEYYADRVGIYANTPKRCRCCTKRDNFGDSMQERRANLDEY